MIEAANHSVRGTRATAETRSAHQGPTPSLAEPRPIARASGERMFWLSCEATGLPSHRRADDPRRDRKHHARHHNGPSGNVYRPKFESVDGVPDQVADATAEMQKKCEGGPEQHDPAKRRPDGCVHSRVGLRPIRSGNQPDDEHDGADTQEYSGDPVRIERTDVSC